MTKFLLFVVTVFFAPGAWAAPHNFAGNFVKRDNPGRKYIFEVKYTDADKAKFILSIFRTDDFKTKRNGSHYEVNGNVGCRYSERDYDHNPDWGTYESVRCGPEIYLYQGRDIYNFIGGNIHLRDFEGHSSIALGLNRVPTECGINQKTIRDRIQDCSTHHGSERFVGKNKEFEWKLVTSKSTDVPGEYFQVWKDMNTGLIWGDRLPAFFTFDNFFPKAGISHAVELNAAGKIVRENACQSPLGVLAAGGIAEVHFRLPTKAEFDTANQHELVWAHQNMSHWFWTTEAQGEYATIFNGVNDQFTTGTFGKAERNDETTSVRCVAKE